MGSIRLTQDQVFPVVYSDRSGAGSSREARSSSYSSGSKRGTQHKQVAGHSSGTGYTSSGGHSGTGSSSQRQFKKETVSVHGHCSGQTRPLEVITISDSDDEQPTE